MMRILRFMILAIMFVIAAQGPVAANVVVEPSDRNSHVRLRGHEVRDRSKASPAPGNHPVGSSPTQQPDPPAFQQCQVDPVVGNYGCRTDEPPEPDDEERPELTPGDVLRAVREIGLPSLRVKIQPGDETLVNVDTIFYADPQPFERSVTLLDFDVDLVAEPVRYDWVHGDGSTRSTDRPGAPYPAMDVTHRYTAPADDVQARVDVTYQVRYRVDDGPWQSLGQTLVAAGPATVLDVKDAAPVLTKR
jgi:hypothetical protein